MPKKGYVRTVVALTGGKKIPIYAGKRVSDALAELSQDMSLYHGVRMSQVMEAVYEQGKKDGARGVFDTVDDLKKTIAHRNPGQPKKRKLRD
jgi:hypothetical protein